MKGWALVTVDGVDIEGHIVVGDDKILFREVGKRTVELPTTVEYIIINEY